MKNRVSTALAAISLASILAACGGGGDGGADPTAGTPSATGVLTDGPVGGVGYSTDGGFSGITDADGQFRYNPGDTLTFKLGALTLGSAPGAPIITPIQLAAGATGLADAAKANLVTNLLVLLQSLDADGNHDNGIAIPAAAVTALNQTAVADAIAAALTGSPAAFAANSAVVAVTGGSVVSPGEAQDQFKAAFMQSLAGVYGGNDFVFRFKADGGYIMGELTDDEVQGIERGTIDWDPATGQVTVTVTQDTNGDAGLSSFTAGSSASLYVSLSGAGLIASGNDSEGPFSLALPRLAQGSGLVGAWGVGDASSLGVQQFIFTADGRFAMLDPVGDTGIPPCGGPGVEAGTYALNGASLTATVTIDTNGCAGLSNSVNIQVTPVDANTMQVTTADLEDGDIVTVTLRRIAD